jgi:succinyl-CoA:mesaconate CoA transferase
MSALADLKVLDLTRVLGGPYCTMLLADLGATVVKVEPPGGDPVRETPPFADDSDAEPYGGYFQSINRGKQSIELDLTCDPDRETFLDLVEQADVLVENYRAGTMESLGLGYERLRDRNPGLVYGSIRGFGDPRTGETDRQGQPTYDLVVQALAGVMEMNGQPDDPPTKVGVGIGDIFTGVLAAVGILAAVHYRDQTGCGQFVDLAMYDSMISLCERAIYQYSYDDHVPGRVGNAHPMFFPYDAFETTDGQVIVAAIGENHWLELCEVIGEPELGAAYTSQQERLDNRQRLREVVADWIQQRSTEEVLDALATRVPCAPVRDVADVFEDEQLRDRGMLIDVDQPGADETMTVAGNPIKMTETPPEPGRRAPLLDEQRTEILEAFGDLATGEVRPNQDAPSPEASDSPN